MHRQLIPSIVALLVLCGCSSQGADPLPPGPPAAQAETVAPAPTPAPAVEPTGRDTEPATEHADVAGEYPSFGELRQLGTRATCESLGDEWCEDSNGNVWPDFVEEAVGRDPSVDGCLRADCGGPEVESFDLAALQENTLFILDASGSMAGDAGGGQTKMDAARSALVEYVTITPEFADLGLIVYGHQGDNSEAGRATSCAGIETFAEVGDLTFENVEEVVGGFQPTGWTPIAAALDAAGPVVQAAADADAAQDLGGVESRIILISDGLETCGGDPVAAAQALLDLGVEVVVDVVGFDIPDSDRAALQQVAEVTGGTYTDAADGAGLRDVLGQYQAQREALSEALSCQVRAMGEAGNCYASLSQDARRHLFDVVQQEAEAAGDDARASFIFDWTNTAIQEARTINDDNRAAMGEALEELRDLYDEAVERREEFNRERNQKPIGRTVSFDCPFADRRPGAA